MTAFETILTSIGASTVVVSVLLWLVRTWIAERLHQAIAHEYAEKLERHRADLASTAAVELEKLKSEHSQERAVRALGDDYLREALRVAHSKRIDAIEKLWSAILLLGRNTPHAVAQTDVMTEAEIRSMAKLPVQKEALSQLSLESVHGRLLAPTSDVPLTRLTSGEYLYALFDAYRTVIGRAGIVLMQSYQKGQVEVWYRDSSILNVLGKVFSSDEMNQFSNLSIGRVTWVRQHIERKFLEAANRVISGQDSAQDAVLQARSVEDAIAAATLNDA